MGVQGLWQLLEPVGRPVTLESLENKVLAVDTSIWLHQMAKGFSDGTEQNSVNPQLQGIFHRLCKLLFYRIKPIFVFDGGVPELKKKTMAARREKKLEASTNASKTSQKILENYIKSKALASVTGRESGVVPVQGRSNVERDMYELPSPPLKLRVSSSESSDEEGNLSLLDQYREQQTQNTFQKSSAVDVESEDFKSLPLEVQHELIEDLREENKHVARYSWEDIPQEANDFSSFQLGNLFKRSRLGQRLDEVRKELNTRNVGDVMPGRTIGDNVAVERIVSEDQAHYILIRGPRKGFKDATVSESQGVTTNEEPTTRKIADDDEIIKGYDSETVKQKIERLLKAKNLLKEKTVQSSSGTSTFSHESAVEGDGVKSGNNTVSTTASNISVSDMEVTNTLKQSNMFYRNTPLLAEERASCSVEKINVAQDENEKLEPSESVSLEEQINEKKRFLEELLQKRGNSAMKRKGNEDKTEVKKFKLVSDDGLDATSTHEIKDVKASFSQTIEGSFNTSQAKEMSMNNPECSLEITVVKDMSGSQGSQAGGMEYYENIDLSCSTGRKEITTVGSSSSSDEDEFIEVKIDPRSTATRDLFLLSDFTKASPTQEEQPQNPSSKDHSHKPGSNVDTPGSSSEPVDIDTVGSSLGDSDLLTMKEALKSSMTPQPNLVLDEQVELDSQNSKNHEKESVLLSRNRTVDEIDVSHKYSASKIAISLTDNLEEERNHEDEEDDRDSNGSFTLEDNLIDEEDVPSSDDDLSLHSEIAASSIPHEWQDATVEQLAEFQDQIESDQVVLQSERSRQNRIAADVSNELYRECQELLQLFGIPYMVCPMEAEAQCAILDLSDVTHGSITDDSDIFLFGGRRVYRNIFRQNKHAEMYISDDIYRIVGLDRSKLINLALLTGSDYTTGIKGIGVVTAMEILNDFEGEELDGLKVFKEWHTSVQGLPRFHEEATKLRNKLRQVKLTEGFPSEQVYMAYMNPTVDDSDERFEWGSPDLHSLRIFAQEKFGWTRNRTDEILLPVLKRLNERQAQPTLDRFFKVKLSPVKKTFSKRVRRAVRQMQNRTNEPGSSQVSNDVTGIDIARGASRENKRGLSRGRARSGARGRGKNQKCLEDKSKYFAENNESCSESEDNNIPLKSQKLTGNKIQKPGQKCSGIIKTSSASTSKLPYVNKVTKESVDNRLDSGGGFFAENGDSLVENSKEVKAQSDYSTSSDSDNEPEYVPALKPVSMLTKPPRGRGRGRSTTRKRR